jgi:beta-galactosidase
MSGIPADRIWYGGDYNPEQWPESVWSEDVRLMREAGVNVATVGVFSWALLEPRPGHYDFGWLDRIVDLLHDNGISVDLATATASPPAWLASRHPESLPVAADGATLWPGSRQAYCPSSVAYRKHSVALVRQLAQRYADHPAVVMWHVNNEYGCHVPACYCDVSAAAFRQWLQNRYGSLARLNEAWGTSFWSQRYDDWDEILPPRRTPTTGNPTQALDFRRFSSDALLDCHRAEVQVLRELSPDTPVTTNFMGFFPPLDYWQWARHEDVVSLDSYPDPAMPGSHRSRAAEGDLMRSLGGGRPWILMEQATSNVNWRDRNAAKPPGRMRLDSYQALARGADGVMFFQWRASRFGAEKFHSAMLPHGGTGTRVWREVTELGAELQRLDAVVGTRVRAQVAIAFDWHSWWAAEQPAHVDNRTDVLALVAQWHRALYEANIAVDFVHPEADLSGYRVLLVPQLYLVTDRAAEGIGRFVADGGRLLMSYLSGLADADDHIRLGGYPAPFTELLGLVVEEFTVQPAGRENRVSWAGASHPCSAWSDVITATGAQVLATFEGDYYAGRPALTRNTHGAGTAWYVGTRLDAPATTELIAQVCADAGVEPVVRAPDGVEAVRRQDADRSFLFLLNHSGEAREVELRRPARSLLDGTDGLLRVTLPPAGVTVLEEPSPA